MDIFPPNSISSAILRWTSSKPWSNYRTSTLLVPTLFDRLATHVERCSTNIFCSIKCWMDFAFDQTLRRTILLDATMLQCLAALPTKLCPESSHFRAPGQSRIDILFSSLGFLHNLQKIWRTRIKEMSWKLINSTSTP